MKGQALGLIETYGYIGAVEAADVCLKSANVRLIGVHLVKGGLVTVTVTGDVGAVRASIDASRVAAEKIA
ncbi:MAG: BMC domain-containing protein, partial [Pseudomonadota bacterium]